MTMIALLRKNIGPASVSCLVFLLLFSMATAQREPVNPGADTPTTLPVVSEKTEVKRKKIREGATVQGQIAVFRQIGNRVSVFISPGNERYTCLENLCLERVLRVLRENTDQVFWKIDGQFTEFQGENFFLLRRAVLSPTGSATGSKTDSATGSAIKPETGPDTRPTEPARSVPPAVR
ncbi:MAG TPA: hypothetical protein DEB39_07900 [Planctomycetaceae bacterium]|nr:hypothetical protein [Planctomycetaceae bacterium]